MADALLIFLRLKVLGCRVKDAEEFLASDSVDDFTTTWDFIHEMDYITCARPNCALEPLEKQEKGLVWNKDTHGEVE